jgi:phytoene synthase
VRDFDLQQEDFLAVIEGMRTDVDGDVRWPSFADFDLYCDRVASAVGRLSVNVFGMERKVGVELSHHLGRALQFTNILRDIDEDAGIGRVYLPIEALRAAGITPVSPETLVTEPNWMPPPAGWPQGPKAFRRGRAHPQKPPQGPSDRPRLMESAYARLLKRMVAAGWNAPHRVKTSKLRLVLALIRFSVWG